MGRSDCSERGGHQEVSSFVCGFGFGAGERHCEDGVGFSSRQ